nr:MCP four helix bundle domain-containing protein [Clostridium saccharobutylicum]
MNSNSKVLYSEDLQALKILQGFNENLLQIRLQTLNITNSRDSTQVDETKTRINDFRKKDNELLNVNNIAQSAHNQAELSQKLNEMVRKFKI